MKFSASLTPEGVEKWVMHRHDFFEVMCYVKGHGFLETPTAKYPFDEKTIIVVPPGVVHSSAAEDGTFRNISVSFEKTGGGLSVFADVTVIRDSSGDGHALAAMIYRNSDCTDSDGGAFSSALMSAYAAYLVRGLERKSGVDEAVDSIKEKILYSFADADFRVSKLLSESGYAVDYIRECFRRRLGKTPVEYVNRLRAEHAARLISVYGGSLGVARLAELSGFADVEYFSRLFKRTFGTTPKKYSEAVKKASAKSKV